MNVKYIACILAVLIVSNTDAKGPVKHKKAKKGNLILLEAYTQRTLPGRPSSAPPPTGNKFIIVWQAATYPETFFWRGDNGFMTCNIQKAHKISSKDAKKFPPGMEYNTENVTGDQIHKGDTLELTPVSRGKFPIPADIPQTAKNTLFYKTGGSGWLAFAVKTIVKKRDISAP